MGAFAWGEVWNGSVAAAYGELRQAAGARVSPSGSPVEWVITTAADNILSGVAATRARGDRVDQAIDDVVGAFAESPAGGLWLLNGGDEPADLADRLEARGLYVGGSGMAATADALIAPPPSPGLRVSEITAADEAAAWENVAAAVWADNPEVAASMAKVFASIRLGRASAVRLFVGWCDQRPVAMATAFVSR